MTDQSIRDALLKLQAILNSATDAIITVNRSGIIVGVNPAMLKMFGYTHKKILEHHMNVLMPEPYRQEQNQYITDYLRTGEPNIIGIGRELAGQRKDGSVFPILLTVTEFQDGDGTMFVGIIHDISERKRITKHFTEAAIEERHRIARELHDGLGGQMTGIALLIKALQKKMESEGSAYAQDLDELTRYIRDAHAQLRDVSSGLAPVEMIPEGLLKALDCLAGITNATDAIHCAFSGDATEVKDPNVALHLYRIAQEAVSNAIRHGQPSQIAITLEHDEHFTTLTISNDGRTIQHQPDGGGGMGIRTMKHRAGLIKGDLSVAPAEGGGTVVTCRVHRTEA